MRRRLARYYQTFPCQLWVVVAGTFVNSLGSALVFPFLTLYLRQRMGISMTQIGLVFTLNAATSVAFGMIGGLLTDRLGRRSVMLVSLLGSSATLFLMGVASSYAAMVALAAAAGIVGSLFQPARDAMVADLTTPEQRTEAYSVLRIASNLGFAIGPAIGGFLAATSYLLLFSLAGGASLAFFVATLILVRETRPDVVETADGSKPAVTGFGPVFRDRTFIAFCGLLVLASMVYSQVTTNLPVYMKESFGLGERYFGWIMTTNAGMVVALQLWITRATARWRRLPALALASLLYGIGVGAISLMRIFPGFLLCVVVYTMGEMILAPVSTAFAADLSPADMRGRYMGLMGLTWGLSYGVGPLLGGAIYDAGFPRELWLFAGAVGVLASIGFAALQRRVRSRVRPAAG